MARGAHEAFPRLRWHDLHALGNAGGVYSRLCPRRTAGAREPHVRVRHVRGVWNVAGDAFRDVHAYGDDERVFERALQQHNIKLSSLQVLMYLGSTESIKLFLEHTDCLGIVSIRSITRELYSGQLRVVEIKDMPMLRDFSFAQPQGQESGLAQVFMQFAMHYNNKL